MLNPKVDSLYIVTSASSIASSVLFSQPFVHGEVSISSQYSQDEWLNCAPQIGSESVPDFDNRTYNMYKRYGLVYDSLTLLILNSLRLQKRKKRHLKISARRKELLPTTSWQDFRCRNTYARTEGLGIICRCLFAAPCIPRSLCLLLALI